MYLPVVYSRVRNAIRSKEAWGSLKSSFENKSPCTRLYLLRRLLRTKFEDVIRMAEYVNGLTTIVQQLADINRVVNDEEVAKLLLGGIASEYEPLIMGIEFKKIR